jgi:hypothetical protein
VETALIALATLVLGAGIGYIARLSEFRRDKRLDAYAEFIGAFLSAVHGGASLYSIYMALGRSMYSADHRDEWREMWDAWTDADRSFENASARLRLIGSRGARLASEAVEAFYSANVQSVPPLTMSQDTSGWGAAAKSGPRTIERDAVAAARTFADKLQPEIIGWRSRAAK